MAYAQRRPTLMLPYGTHALLKNTFDHGHPSRGLVLRPVAHIRLPGLLVPATKRDLGEAIVRIYYPLCLEPSVLENALRAGIENDVAIMFQEAWTNFGEGVSSNTTPFSFGRDSSWRSPMFDEWRQSQQAIYDVLESSEFEPIAPYHGGGQQSSIASTVLGEARRDVRDFQGNQRGLVSPYLARRGGGPSIACMKRMGPM
ncbi:Uu.00g110350.m01.CDS01 [Anthostomella pinea]|uniref:Uu.00g110350.m01.CDS01 n=1 Tax=Anthostomella pinea TaxID=933095 RepID=A0AAI8VEY7_9PEZI|nr:Uu.00g110350.m01.CDS01 [Anthostomella pinea]